MSIESLVELMNIVSIAAQDARKDKEEEKDE